MGSKIRKNREHFYAAGFFNYNINIDYGFFTYWFGAPGVGILLATCAPLL